MTDSVWSRIPSTTRVISGGCDYRCDLSETHRNWGLSNGFTRSFESRLKGRNANNRDQDRTASTQLSNDESNVLGWVTMNLFLGVPMEKWVVPIDLKPEDRAVLGKHFVRTIQTSGEHNLRVGDEEEIFVPDDWQYTLIEVSDNGWTTYMRGFNYASVLRADIKEHIASRCITAGYSNPIPGVWYVYQGLLLPMPEPTHKLPGLD